MKNIYRQKQNSKQINKLLLLITTLYIIIFLFFSETLVLSLPPPRNPLSHDSDGDGLCDDCETSIFGTNPILKDTDGDGLQDNYEDHDKDGVSNFDELKKCLALKSALESGNISYVQPLIEYWPWVTIVQFDNYTALHLAVKSGSKEKVQLLLEAGADADVNTRSIVGLTALMKAAYLGNSEIVRSLLDAGANINMTDKFGSTALEIAYEGGHIEIVSMLF